MPPRARSRRLRASRYLSFGRRSSVRCHIFHVGNFAYLKISKKSWRGDGVQLASVDSRSLKIPIGQVIAYTLATHPEVAVPGCASRFKYFFSSSHLIISFVPVEKNGKTLHLLKHSAKPTPADRKRRKIPLKGTIQEY